MIHTTAMRKSQAEDRISIRSSVQSLTNIIAKGCCISPFEAATVAEKAQEAFKIGPYGFENEAQPGQMVWKAISADEPPGKPLKSCVFKDIRLSVHVLEEDQEVKKKFGMSKKRQQQIIRMTEQALDQETLLTQEDIATILDCDVKTIRRDIQKLQSRLGILVPTRGNKLDIGPGITHRDKVIEKFIQGQDGVAIARDLTHSLKAVERYINTFCRILFCQKQLKNTLKCAMVVGVSVPLVTRCLGLAEDLRKKPEYNERLEVIDEKGLQFWEAQDVKKKSGQSKRRIR